MVVKGKKLTFKEYLLKIKNELKDMTWKQRFAHLWEYYKWVLGVLIIIIVIIAATVTFIINANTQVFLSGKLINTSMSMDGRRFLIDGYMARKGTDNYDQVLLSDSLIEDRNTTMDPAYTYDMIMAVVADISARNVDYLIVDGIGLAEFGSPDYAMDLREIFSQEELDGMGTAVQKVYVESNGETIPVAIDIRTTKFVKDFIENEGPVYLMFALTSVRKDACRDFWDYIVEYGGGLSLESVMAGATTVELKAEGENMLITQYFKRLNADPGVQTISLLKKNGASAQEMEAVGKALASGELDYLLTDYSAMEHIKDPSVYLDLRNLFTEEQLDNMDVYYLTDTQSGEEIPVALELNEAYDLQQHVAQIKKTVLVFGAGTTHKDRCLDLFEHVYGDQES